MEVTRQISIGAPADKVWKILGTDFGEIQVWASRMLSSKGDTSLGSQGGRVVNTVEYGEATETLYLFDDAQRELAYTVQGPTLPPIIKDVTTGWKVEAASEGEAVVHLTFGATVLDPSMEDMVKDQLGQGLDKLLPELKYFAENDRPHPNKQQ